MTDDQVALLLQMALLGEVSPALRGVTFRISPKAIRLAFYYDGEIAEADRESASLVETELLAHLPEDERVETELIRLDAPTRPQALSRWVYRRRE